jgi:hypothetical protein
VYRTRAKDLRFSWRVIPGQPDISEEHIASIFEVEEQAKQETCRRRLPPFSAGFLLSLLFGPEDGDSMFLRTVWLFPNYTVLQTRKGHSSVKEL